LFAARVDKNFVAPFVVHIMMILLFYELLPHPQQRCHRQQR
jgi:preprotein translocase subunit YajC